MLLVLLLEILVSVCRVLVLLYLAVLGQLVSTGCKLVVAAGWRLVRPLHSRYCQLQCGAPPQLLYRKGSRIAAVLRQCPALRQPFCPTLWARHRHLQTLLGGVRTLTCKAQYHREVVILKAPFGDGGSLALDWHCVCGAPRRLAPTTPVLLILHHLSGGSKSGYVKWMCASAFAKKGFRPVVLTYRGCDGLELKSPTVASATATADAHAAMWAIKRRFPKAPLLAVGYGSGALLLARYLAEYDQGCFGGGDPIAAAAMVSSPFSLGASAVDLLAPLADPLAALYNLAAAARWRLYIRRHAACLAQNQALDMAALAGVTCLAHVTDRLIARASGLASAAEYYQESASRHFIPAIRTRSLFLSALDDPFLGELPLAEVAANGYTALALTRRGGHLGFLSGLLPFGRAWSDTVVLQFLSACLAQPAGRDDDC